MKYNGFDLTTIGIPTLRISRRADPPEAPTCLISTYDVGIQVYERTSDEVWSRLRQVLHTFSTPEGVLILEGDNGTSRSIRVSHRSDNIAEVISAGKGTITLTLQSWENTDTALHPHPTASLVIGAREIFLDHVRDYSEGATTEYASHSTTARQRTNVTISFKARVRQADPNLTLAQRMTSLTALAREYDVLRANAANFIFGGSPQIVRINNVSPSIDAEARYLELAIQLSRSIFPGADQAVADYKADYSDDFSEGKAARQFTVSGTIDAHDPMAAQALLHEIKDRHAIPGRSPQMQRTTDRYVESTEDDSAQRWVGLDFQISWKIIPEETAYTIAISTNKDLESGTGRTVYSGTVTGGSEAAALAKAQELGLGRLPVLLRSTETISRATDQALSEIFSTVQFSYEYRSPGDGTISGNVRIENVSGSFGEHTTTVSGTVVADTQSVATTVARSLIVSGTVLKDRRETPRYSLRDGVQHFESLDFTYLITQSHSGPVGMSYTRAVSPDFTTLIERVTYSGQIFAPTEEAAEAELTQIANSLGLSPTQRDVSHSKLKTSGYSAHHITTSFTLGFERALTGATGYDLLEGTYTIERIGQVRREATTEVAGSAPYQYNTGTYNVGMLTVSGSCKARTAEGARKWAQAKRALAARYPVGQTSYPGAENEPRESLTPIFAKLDLNTPLTYQFAFTYSFRYARKPNTQETVMPDLWPEGFSGA